MQQALFALKCLFEELCEETPDLIKKKLKQEIYTETGKLD